MESDIALFYKKLAEDQIRCPPEFCKAINENFDELLNQVESCNFCIHRGKHPDCEPELGVCDCYVDGRYVNSKDFI
jgi:hypothetical protein